MCGRYTLTTDLIRIKAEFGGEPDADLIWRPRYNIAPSQEAPIVLSDRGARVIRLARFGLIPRWAPKDGKGEKMAFKMINARAETVGEKPAYREAIRKRRCIVPADGFYEWKAAGGRKLPFRIRFKKEGLFGFAAIWESWEPPKGGPISSFSIITTQANPDVRSLHERMPVILPNDPETRERWLDPGNQDLGRIEDLLQPAPAGKLEIYPVSTLVNSPKNDDPELIERFEIQKDLFG